MYKEKIAEIFCKIRDDDSIEYEEKKNIYSQLIMDINSFIRYINTVIQIEEKLQKMFMGSDEGFKAYKNTITEMDAKRMVLHHKVRNSIIVLNGYTIKYGLSKFCDVELTDKDEIANIVARIVAELNNLRCDYSKVNLDSLDKEVSFYEVSIEDFIAIR